MFIAWWSLWQFRVCLTDEWRIVIQTVTHRDQITPCNIAIKLNFITENYKFYAIYLCLRLSPRVLAVKALTFMSQFVFVFLSDSKQNGDANVALSEEEGCSLTQPLSPSEKWSLRCSRGRAKAKKEATCFLLTSGDPDIHTGEFHTYQYNFIYTHSACSVSEIKHDVHCCEWVEGQVPKLRWYIATF